MAETVSSDRASVLFIEDDADVRAAAELLLRRHGWRMFGAATPRESWGLLATEPVDVILLDLNFQRGATSGEEGLRHLAALAAHDPTSAIVVVTGHSGINIAVAAMRSGAADFVMKPWSNDRLMATLRDALALRQKRRNAAEPPIDAAPAPADDVILGESAQIERVRRLTQRAAPTAASVLVYGGVGDGKELAARTIHRQSGRAAFLAIDCPGRSADAVAAAVLGAPPEATLFLDEVAELTADAQAALRAALEAREDLRPIAGTRRSREALQGDAMRQDLLYRLSTIEIEIAPLHERIGDAAFLARHFLAVYARRHGQGARPLSASVAAALAAARWSGGVRELKTRMERAVLLGDGEAYEPSDLGLDGPAAADPAPAPPNLAQTERAMVEAALKRHGFNVSRAAAELGLTRTALYRRMAKHGL
jgi:DNA-binding NtrC family response regulator